MDHIFVGITLGMLCGALYFIIEPLLIYKSSHPYFGVSLGRVLFVYLLFGCVLGVIVGLFAGISNAIMRRRLSTLHPIPVVFSVLGFILTFLFIMRNHTLSHMKAFHTSPMIYSIAALLVWAGIAFFLSRILNRKSEPRRTGSIRMIASAVLAVAFIAAMGILSQITHYRLPGRKPMNANSPNIVMIIADALRPDHLEAYGYARNTSPYLARLADDGTLFSKAYAHGNRTYYTMPALFTSLQHYDHGFLWTPEMIYPLPESRVTIAEMLQEAGYNTVGMMSNVMIKSELQMTQGFDRVEEFNTEHFHLSVYRVLRYLGFLVKPDRTPDAGQVTDKVVPWLDKFQDNPFFLFVHYMDTHHAYTPPKEYERMFRSTDNGTEPMALFKATKKFLSNPKVESFDGDELKRLIDLYDACVRYVDDEIGRLIEKLQSLSLDRETIVIVTADHGDEFMEHGLLYHNNVLIEELIRVPLIIWSSGKNYANRKVDCLVRHIDVMPTVAEWAGVDPPADITGVSLVPLIEGAEDELNLELIAEGAESTCLISENWKILHVDSTDSYYLYDLSVDSWGQMDLSQDYPEKLTLLKSKLTEYLDKARKSDAEERKPMSPDMIKQLKALGYL
jgi:arylsulfatase A-like enzyme